MMAMVGHGVGPDRFGYNTRIVESKTPLPAKRAHLEVPAEPASAAVARRFIGTMVALWDCDDPEQLAVLLTSEIVANAVRHAHRDIRVDVVADNAAVRVSTTDDDPRMPRLMIVPRGATSGRGLFLVDALASAWGVDPSPPGKTVWFELRPGAGEG
jgi:anti-sigma regulatory factor (Ser/Thr protein kinase)